MQTKGPAAESRAEEAAAGDDRQIERTEVAFACHRQIGPQRVFFRDLRIADHLNRPETELARRAIRQGARPAHALDFRSRFHVALDVGIELLQRLGSRPGRVGAERQAEVQRQHARAVHAVARIDVDQYEERAQQQPGAAEKQDGGRHLAGHQHAAEASASGGRAALRGQRLQERTARRVPRRHQPEHDADENRRGETEGRHARVELERPPRARASPAGSTRAPHER